MVRLSEQNFRFYCDELCHLEVAFLSVKENYGYPTFWKRSEGYQSLIQIILEQQVSLASAKAHFNKLKASCSPLLPEILVEWTDEKFNNCQVSRQKASYIRNLSSAVLEKKLIFENLSTESDEDAIHLLTSIKGIGKWTADIYLMFCLNRPNRFPLGDIALIQSMKYCFPYEPSENYQQFVDSWSPYKTIAAYFLWWEYLNRKNKLNSLYP